MSEFRKCTLGLQWYTWAEACSKCTESLEMLLSLKPWLLAQSKMREQRNMTRELTRPQTALSLIQLTPPALSQLLKSLYATLDLPRQPKPFRGPRAEPGFLKPCAYLCLLNLQDKNRPASRPIQQTWAMPQNWEHLRTRSGGHPKGQWSSMLQSHTAQIPTPAPPPRVCTWPWMSNTTAPDSAGLSVQWCSCLRG